MIHHRPQGFEHHFFRRSYLIGSAAVGGSMVLSLSLPVGEGNVRSTESSTPNAFISIDGDGKVVLTMPQLGMGQGICTSIPMLIAEELEVAPNQVHLEHAPPKQGLNGDATVDARTTGDSNAIRDTLKLLGEAGATARVMLMAAAAMRWGVDARSCHAHGGEVIHTPTWRKLGYGELAIDAAWMPIPKEVALKAPPAQSRTDQLAEGG
jgi:isoquinoline 1-oxidoreductase subunit beta